MPRFHFNVHDGQGIADTEGFELPCRDTARREAIVLSGALIRDRAREFRFEKDWRLEVTDESGLILYRLDFTVHESSAVKVRGR